MHHSLSVELAALSHELHSDLDITETIQAILRHAPTLTGCDQASVMLGAGGAAEVASATDTQAKQADLLQVQFDEGPSLAAMSVLRPIVIGDIASDSRWQRWATEVTGLGLNGVVSVRLGTGKDTLGALSLYSPRTAWFRSDHVAAANLCARLTSVAVASTQRISMLRRALDDRTVVGQAQACLQERRGWDSEKAITMLHRYARDRDLDLNDAAERVVADLNVLDG